MELWCCQAWERGRGSPGEKRAPENEATSCQRKPSSAQQTSWGHIHFSDVLGTVLMHVLLHDISIVASSALAT